MRARAAAGNAAEGDWIVADVQDAGRGRHGRVWQSPPGNLYASGLVVLRETDTPAPMLALVAGLAVCDVVSGVAATLKWPNDVMLGTAKLAGILLERHDRHVVVGVGLNLAHHPELPDRPATSLAAYGVTLGVDAAIAALAARFACWLARWRDDGVAAITAAWCDRAHPVGTLLSAAQGDGMRIAGRFDGLTPDGALRLALADGSHRVIHAADVFLV